jgi:hypothetical protein
MNLNLEGYTSSMELQLGIWEPSQHLLRDRGKPRNLCRDGLSQDLPDAY